MENLKISLLKKNKKKNNLFKNFREKGDKVKKCVNAQQILGNLILNFKNKKKCLNFTRGLRNL